MDGHDVAGVMIAKVEARWVCSGDRVGCSCVLGVPPYGVLDVVDGMEGESRGDDGLG